MPGSQCETPIPVVGRRLRLQGNAENVITVGAMNKYGVCVLARSSSVGAGRQWTEVEAGYNVVAGRSELNVIIGNGQ